MPDDPSQRYSTEALKADLRFVHNNLEKRHPGLYRYISKPLLDRFFDSVDHVITGPMTAQEFFRLLTLLHSRIRNGHTMFLPGDSAMAWLNRSGRLLPVGVYVENGKWRIVENYSADSTLQAGSEMLSINGLSVSSIMEQLLARQVRDGYNRTYPIWMYHQDYKQQFDSVFTQISRHQIRSLILDLRDNQGGDFSPGRALLSFLVLHPSRFLLDGKEARIIQPAANHFRGRLFVLMNGGSFSSTAIVCACLKRDRRALFIGEETGGNAHVISGDPVELVLPRTRIKAEISTTIYRIAPGPNDGHGVMPDYPIRPTMAEILAGKDPAKALAMTLSSEN